ncbi:MAG: MFS transporter [Woeseia sp.]
MTKADSALLYQQTVFDGWRSMSIALYMSLVGYGVLVGIPVISTAWVNLLGFTEVQVGRVAGADLGGLSLGAVVTALLVAKYNRRYLVLASAAIAIAANALCMFMVEYQQVLWLRFMAGIGSGIYTAVAVATLGATSRPARAFNIMLFTFAFSQALELYTLPLLSMNGIYFVFIGCYLVSLPFVSWVPPRPRDTELNVELAVKEPDGEAHREKRHVPAYVPWLVLAAIVTTYINIGAYWTYIELASIASNATRSWVSSILVWASFCSLLGCLFATLISNRFGLARPLLVTLILQAGIVVMLVGGINDANIVISMFGFNFLWICWPVSSPTQLAPSRRLCATSKEPAWDPRMPVRAGG